MTLQRYNNNEMVATNFDAYQDLVHQLHFLTAHDYAVEMLRTRYGVGADDGSTMHGLNNAGMQRTLEADGSMVLKCSDGWVHRNSMTWSWLYAFAKRRPSVSERNPARTIGRVSFFLAGILLVC